MRLSSNEESDHSPEVVAEHSEAEWPRLPKRNIRGLAAELSRRSHQKDKFVLTSKIPFKPNTTKVVKDENVKNFEKHVQDS